MAALPVGEVIAVVRCRVVRGVLMVLLLLLVVLGGQAISGCRTGIKVSVERDPRVFTLFAGIAAVAHRDEAAALGSEALRQQVKQATADWAAGSISVFDHFSADLHREPDVIAGILDAGPPPDFSWLSPYGSGVSTGLAALWKDIEPLYEATLRGEPPESSTLAAMAPDTIRAALNYIGLETSPYGQWRIVTDPLAEPGFSSSHADTTTRTAWIIAGPSSATQVEAVAREAFRLLLSDDQYFYRLEATGALDRFRPCFEWAGAFRPWRGHSLAQYVRENLAHALAIRVSKPTEPQARLDAAWNDGLVLAPAFYEELEALDKSGAGVDIEPLLEAADVAAMLKERAEVGQWRLLVWDESRYLDAYGGERDSDGRYHYYKDVYHEGVFL